MSCFADNELEDEMLKTPTVLLQGKTHVPLRLWQNPADNSSLLTQPPGYEALHFKLCNFAISPKAKGIKTEVQVKFILFLF